MPTSPMPTDSKYFQESELPSIASKFYTASEERTVRRKTCRFLEEACKILELPVVVRATSMVFFHRFYACHSFKDHDRFEVAVACILLAAKTEESPRRLTSVIQECYKLKHSSRKPPTSSPQEYMLDPKSEEFSAIKDQTLKLERIILHTIGFDLSIDHPYTDVFRMIPLLLSQNLVEYHSNTSTGPSTLSSMNPSERNKDFHQFAINFTNDSMQTSLCLQYPPRIIALVCIYMSGVYCQMRPTMNQTWIQLLSNLNRDFSEKEKNQDWDEENQLDMYKLANIAIQMMELIRDRKELVPWDKYAGLEKDVEALKKEYYRMVAVSGTSTTTTSSSSSGGSGSNVIVDGSQFKRQKI